MDWSEAVENNSVLFWRKKTCEIHFRISLISPSQKTSGHKSTFGSIFVPRQKTGENRVNKDKSFIMQICIELLCRVSDLGLENYGLWLVQAKKDLDSSG